jgi:hypothetical protein
MAIRVPIALIHEALAGGWPGVLVGIIAVAVFISAGKDMWSGGPLAWMARLGLGAVIGVMALWVVQNILEWIFKLIGGYLTLIAVFAGLIAGLTWYFHVSDVVRKMLRIPEAHGTAAEGKPRARPK